MSVVVADIDQAFEACESCGHACVRVLPYQIPFSALSVDLGEKDQERSNHNPVTNWAKRLVEIRYAISVAGPVCLLLDDAGVYW